jgi:putative zinc finger protein
MTGLTCAAVRQRLAAYHDDELDVQERIAVQAHVNICDACGSELNGYQDVSQALRLAAAPGPADDWTGLTPGVISRMRAEANEAWLAKIGRMFDDMHLVWIALASTAGTLIVGAAVLGMLRFASPEREDSLRGLLAMVSAVPGSDLNPAGIDGLAVQAPSVPEDGLINASLERSGQGAEQMLAFAAVITRDGNIAAMQALGDGRGSRQVTALINELSRGRLEPARYGTDPLAVSMVWVVEHVTVKPPVSRSRLVGS